VGKHQHARQHALFALIRRVRGLRCSYIQHSDAVEAAAGHLEGQGKEGMHSREHKSAGFYSLCNMTKKGDQVQRRV
jgi:hypothetical protein